MPDFNVVFVLYFRSKTFYVDFPSRQRVYLITHTEGDGRSCYEIILPRGAEFSGVILDPVAQGMIPPEHTIIHLGSPDTPRVSINESDRDTIDFTARTVEYREVVNLADSADDGTGDNAPMPAVPSVSVPLAATVSETAGTSTVAHSGLSDAMGDVSVDAVVSVSIADSVTVAPHADSIAAPNSPNGTRKQCSWGSIMELTSVDPPASVATANSPASPDAQRGWRDMTFSPEPQPRRYERFGSERSRSDRLGNLRRAPDDRRVRQLLSRRREHERKIVKRAPGHPLRDLLTKLLTGIAEELGDLDYRVPDYNPSLRAAANRENANRESATREAAALRARLAELERSTG